MILSAQSIRRRHIFTPFNERTHAYGMTYGLGPAGYDVRVAEDMWLPPFGIMRLASTLEHFVMPIDLIGTIADKSTWVRRGVCVQNSRIEPGWRGFLTLELTNHTLLPIRVRKGMPIAQIVLHLMDEPTEQPYGEHGKYQDQRAGPVAAILERDEVE